MHENEKLVRAYFAAVHAKDIDTMLSMLHDDFEYRNMPYDRRMTSKADKRKFVRIFLEALLSLPRSLWRPMVVVVDEAHEFCGESTRDCESREAVIRLMDSGRKRGICGILATPLWARKVTLLSSIHLGALEAIVLQAQPQMPSISPRSTFRIMSPEV